MGDKMRKFLGIVIIIFSSLIGLFCAIGYGESLIISNIIFWLISFPIYIAGQKVRTSKYQFKMEGNQWIRNYIYMFFIMPLMIHAAIKYAEMKEDAFGDEKYIFFNHEYSFLGEMNLLLFIVLIFLVGGLVMGNPTKKGLLFTLIIGTASLTIWLSYFMFSEYRGVHEELGLVSSDRKGNITIIPYEELEGVYLEAYISYGGRRTSDTVWAVTFKPNNHSEVKYSSSDFSKSALESIIDVREIVVGKGIPFLAKRMDKTTFSDFDYMLELKKLDKQRYYDLFQINN